MALIFSRGQKFVSQFSCKCAAFMTPFFQSLAYVCEDIAMIFNFQLSEHEHRNIMFSLHTCVLFMSKAGTEKE